MGDRNHELTVTVKTHFPVDTEELVQYVEDAVASWGGQFHPSDPFFKTNIEKVKVRAQR